MIQESVNATSKYSELLGELLRISNKFSFVIRSNYTISETEKKILSLFGRFLLLETEVETWPGTILLYGKKARIYYYVFNQETFDLLKKTSDDLYEWLHPEKPEDLCFYNNDKPVFASISHERDSFFLVENAEVIDTKLKGKRQAQ
jgi:hypothetical protein